MNQYYILESQQYYPSMKYGHIVHFTYDADPEKVHIKAQSKYHEVLAIATISELPSYSVTLITSDGCALMNQCYKHIIEQTTSELNEPIEE